MDLKDQTVVVTGSARRVGKTIALRLARAGANIIVHYRDSEKEAWETVREIEALGVKAVALQADLADTHQAERFSYETLQTFQGVNALVNSASVFYPTPLQSLDAQEFETFVAANLKGPYLTSLIIGREMKHLRRGKIINITDWAIERPYKSFIPYMISKGGLHTMTKALAVELAPEVQVNAIAPGPVLPPEDMDEQEMRNIIDQTLVKKLGSPEDIAEAVMFLMTGGDFVTGQTVTVDGGRSLA